MLDKLSVPLTKCFFFLWSMNINLKFNFLALSADLNWLEHSRGIISIARGFQEQNPTARRLRVSLSENSYKLNIIKVFFSCLITLLTIKPCQH